MKRKHTSLTLLVACVIAALAASAATFFGIYAAIGGREGLKVLSKAAAVQSVINSSYVGEANTQDLQDGLADGMINALDDQWSYYMTAEDYQNYQNRVANTVNGIGVTVARDEETGFFSVKAVTEGSSAEEAGVQAGDLIVSVAGQSVEGLATDELRALFQEQNGSFSLGLRDREGNERSVSVSVGVYYSNPVRYELLPEKLGLIVLSNFESGSAENTRAAVEDLMGQGADGIIFDVRYNPGGQLSELTALLDYLLPEGEIFVSVSKDGDEKIYTSDASCVEIPMAVLINEYSYSAAEFFAAALREYDYATVVGEASTGKGRSQSTIELADGSAVHISSRRYLTPKRIDLSEQGGLEPDIVITADGDGSKQLEAAKEALLMEILGDDYLPPAEESAESASPAEEGSEEKDAVPPEE